MRTIIITAIIGLSVIIGIISIVAFVNWQKDINKTEAIYISNLDSCSNNMKESLQESMRTNMYDTIKMANDYNKQETLPRYEAVLREGTCAEKDISISGIDNQEADIKETTAILDIPEAKQSWDIVYHWVPNGTDVTTDLGTIITPRCLSEEKLIYGDFKCENIMSLREFGTDQYDPILQYMPYTGAGFTLEYTPDTKAVEATIVVRPSDKNNKTLQNNLKAQVVYWFSYRKLDITAYKVSYVFTDTLSQSQEYSHGD